jgi:hypothetical protein
MTIKSRLLKLEQRIRFLTVADHIRQREGRSDEDLEFFALHGWFETRNNNQRVVTAEEVRTYEAECRALVAGRTKQEVEYFIANCHWPGEEPET